MAKKRKEAEKFILQAVESRFDLLTKCEETMKLIYDEADHALYTEAANPKEVMTRNLRVIRAMAKRKIEDIRNLTEEGL